MKKLQVWFMASWFSFLLSGCASRGDKVLYEGNYNGQPYVVKSRETKTFNGNRTDWLVKLGDLREVPVIVTMRFGTPVSPPGEITTDWGVPFDDDIFGAHERTYFGVAPAYSSQGDDYKNSSPLQNDHTVLYLSKLFSAEQYRQYTAFMKAEWAKVDKALASSAHNGFPHIVGTVHGSRSLFIRTFKGNINGVAHVLRVDPDGFVNLDVDDAAASQNRVRHCKVQMPQKAIRLHEIYLWKDFKTTKANIAGFKDAQGKTPDAFFTLQN